MNLNSFAFTIACDFILHLPEFFNVTCFISSDIKDEEKLRTSYCYVFSEKFTGLAGLKTKRIKTRKSEEKLKKEKEKKKKRKEKKSRIYNPHSK